MLVVRRTAVKFILMLQPFKNPVLATLSLAKLHVVLRLKDDIANVSRLFTIGEYAQKMR